MPYTLSTAPLLSFLTVTPGQGIDASNQLIVSTVGTPNLTLNTTGNLGQIANINTNGILCITDAQDTVATRIIANTGTITAVNPDGVAGNISLNVVPSSSLQWLQPYLNGAARGPDGNPLSPRPTFNFIPATGVGLAVVDNPGANRTDITISGTALGTISSITSTGATIKVTNPTGPTTNIEAVNWANFAANGTNPININNNQLGDVQGVQFFPWGQPLALSLYQNHIGNPVTTNCLAITDGNAATQGNIGLVYDSHFNPPPAGVAKGTQLIGSTNPAAPTPTSSNTIYYLIPDPAHPTLPTYISLPLTAAAGEFVTYINLNINGATLYTALGVQSINWLSSAAPTSLQFLEYGGSVTLINFQSNNAIYFVTSSFGNFNLA